MSLEVSVVCDTCSARLATDTTGYLAREQAKADLARTSLPGGEDMCLECYEQEASR
jgi:hypothetical protein